MCYDTKRKHLWIHVQSIFHYNNMRSTAKYKGSFTTTAYVLNVIKLHVFQSWHMGQPVMHHNVCMSVCKYWCNLNCSVLCLVLKFDTSQCISFHMYAHEANCGQNVDGTCESTANCKQNMSDTFLEACRTVDGPFACKEWVVSCEQMRLWQF
jgi:hypothetical protein